jgi:NAD(P)-dependent dehydrogenase (short-subunit alcohol dehydrogenase family)
MSSIAVITGANGGIGVATTRELAAAGWTVVATARRPEASGELRELAEQFPEVSVRALDVTSDESVDSCIGSVLADLGSIDLLVNNAGAGHRGTLEQLTIEELSQSMDLNFFGVARVTKAVLPAMRKARGGRVITVTSLNGIVALPFSDAYNAAKFAVEGLMESLAAVMREFGVSISVLEPGPVRTAFFANLSGHADAVEDDDPYAVLVNRLNSRIRGPVARVGGRRHPGDRRRPVSGAAVPVIGGVTRLRGAQAGRRHWTQCPGRDRNADPALNRHRHRAGGHRAGDGWDAVGMCGSRRFIVYGVPGRLLG